MNKFILILVLTLDFYAGFYCGRIGVKQHLAAQCQEFEIQSLAAQKTAQNVATREARAKALEFCLSVKGYIKSLEKENQRLKTNLEIQ